MKKGKFMKKGKLALEAIIISTIIMTVPMAHAFDASKKAGEYVGGWKTKTKKDIYKYIPKEAYKNKQVYAVDSNYNGLYDTYFYDKNKNKKVDKGEIFIDLNEDGIIDYPLTQLKYEEFEC